MRARGRGRAPGREAECGRSVSGQLRVFFRAQSQVPGQGGSQGAVRHACGAVLEAGHGFRDGRGVCGGFATVDRGRSRRVAGTVRHAGGVNMATSLLADYMEGAAQRLLASPVRSLAFSSLYHLLTTARLAVSLLLVLCPFARFHTSAGQAAAGVRSPGLPRQRRHRQACALLIALARARAPGATVMCGVAHAVFAPLCAVRVLWWVAGACWVLTHT